MAEQSLTDGTKQLGSPRSGMLPNPRQIRACGVALVSKGIRLELGSASQRAFGADLALNVPNSTAQYPTVTVVSQYGGGQTESGKVFVAPATESFTHDADGNLTQDGRWDLVWDGENRLVKLRSRLGSPAPERRIEFEYDHQGRRIRQTVFNDRDGGQGSELSDTIFLYDGWNLVAELNANASNARVRTYVWGADLSGTTQGARGVGGLLKVTYHGASTTNAFVAYDGNGNVMALVDASNGSVCARYEYGPFAEPIRVSGPMGKLNPVRFSSKYTDDESGFLYYGYRYYNPSTGRWLSRDAIGERGGFNLCTFVANDPLGYVDHSGLAVYPLGRTDPKGNPWPQPAPIPFPPGGPVNPTPNLPPNSPNLPTTPASTPMQGAAGAIPIAAEYFAAGLEQWLLNYYIDEGLKYCRAQAKQKGGCCFGCCVINLYLVTGKYDSYRNLFSGSPQFFSKPCFSVQADMAVIDSQPGLEPYFGRWEYERWWGYRLVNPNAPDANRMRPIDDQSHIRRYLDMLSCNAK